MNVKASINGQPALNVRIELRRNGATSTCRAELPPGAALRVGDHIEVELGDGQTERAFRQFTCRRVEQLGDGRVVLHASDMRESWSCPAPVEINVPVGDGTAWREGEPVSVQGVVSRLFVASGLPDPVPRLQPTLHPPVTLKSRGSLASGLDRLLEQIGQALTVDDAGEYLLVDAGREPEIDASSMIEFLTSAAQARVRVTGGAPVELLSVGEWEPMLPDHAGKVRPIVDVLSEWGITENAARQACLSDGGFGTLLPATGHNAADRLATLKRFAFRLFHAKEGGAPWLPVGGLLDDGELAPPVVEATFTRARGVAPDHPRSSAFETLHAQAIEAFELDPERRLLYLPHPPYRLDDAGDATLQSARLQGEPVIELRIGTLADRPPLVVELGEGDETVHLHAPHLVAVYQDGKRLNDSRLRAGMNELAARQMHRFVRRETRLAGVHPHTACGTVDRVVIEAGERGLTTTLREAPSSISLNVADNVERSKFHRSGQALPSGLHQPINAFRSGPLILRADGTAPESESVLVMRAGHRRTDTGALELSEPGSLAFPFHLASREAPKFGRWFFVAGAEVTEDGRVRVLAPDDRHEELDPLDYIDARHERPKGLRGLLVSLGDEPEFVDVGPIVSDSRGREPGATSSLVHDLDGSSLSVRKRGGLQFLSVLALSPAHQQEGTRDRGWVPALNFREGDTAHPEVLGRGLFAEGSGRDLGRMTAKLQGGPMLADPGACSKHRYGQASDDDGVYREASGHISTEAFFKVPGDPVHDAPIKFYREPFTGGVPHWRPYEAQIKYDASEKHPWNHKRREGLWKIQYRVPFFPEIPPTWKPPIAPPPEEPPTDDPPAISNPAMQTVPYELFPIVTEHEVWAPSHDWIPAPSERDNEREIPMRGPSVTSEGWAGEDDGVPDPSLGGGCIYLPPGLPLPEALSDNGERQTYLALHPQVVLAFGYPGFSGDPQGHVHSGWAIQLASGGDLEVLPKDVDASIPGGLTRGMHVTGHMQLGPDGATFGESQALRLGAGSGEGIAFGEDVNLYREGADVLRTDDDLEVGGKLTVEGLIDPTGLELEAQSSNPGNVGSNTLWINSSDGRLYFGNNKLAFVSELPEE